MIELEQHAFLLHSRPYRENQLILNLLTQQSGKVSAITYSSHSVKSFKKALLQPFTPLTIVLKGNASLQKLVRVEPCGKSFKLVERFLYSGFYLNELLVRLLDEHVPCDGLFNQYKKSLTALNDGAEIEPILRNFELVLLDELGLSLDFSELFSDHATHFNFIQEQGFVPAIKNSKYPKYEKAHLISIARQDTLTTEAKKTFKLLMRQVFDNILGTKPLNSRKLFTK